MEALTRLVADSLARHGFDRPIDPCRLQWSRWFRCDSPHSLLVIPSKPGIFAIAEEICGAADAFVRPTAANVEMAVLGCSTERLPTEGVGDYQSAPLGGAADTILRSNGPNAILDGAALRPSGSESHKTAALAADATSRRMLAVLQFSEDDDMAFVLDRMFTRINPMRSRLASGRCFIRFVVIADQQERRTICAALNQWMRNSAEKASGLPADFSSSLELTAEHMGRAASRAKAGSSNPANSAFVPPQLASDPATNIHRPHPLPSGF
jgi:hypothetical protein